MKKVISFLILIFLIGLTVSLGGDIKQEVPTGEKEETQTKVETVEPDFVTFLEDFIYV